MCAVVEQALLNLIVVSSRFGKALPLHHGCEPLESGSFAEHYSQQQHKKRRVKDRQTNFADELWGVKMVTSNARSDGSRPPEHAGAKRDEECAEHDVEIGRNKHLHEIESQRICQAVELPVVEQELVDLLLRRRVLLGNK